MGAATINRLLLTSVPLSWYDYRLISNGTVVSFIEYKYDADTNTWVLYKEATEAISYGYRTWWSNTDIYDSTGTLYLAASDPVPVGTITDPVSFVMGYQLGCRLRAQRGAKKPIAYLYNGVQLPPLPEWDKEQYHYAAILSYSDHLTLYVTENALYWNDGCIRPMKTAYKTWVADDDTWGSESTFDNMSWEVSHSKLNGTPIWSNYDITNKVDDSVYLSASDPVPVYGWETLFEGDVTTEDFDYDNSTSKANIIDAGEAQLFSDGDILRLTINDTSAIKKAVTYNALSVAVGNSYVVNGSNEDDAFDYCVLVTNDFLNIPTGYDTTFYARSAGDYNVRIERAVI
jgi:hypothetical protein